LINLVNSILEDQKDKEENEIIIIFFGDNAKLIRKLSYKDLNENEEWKLTREDINQINTGNTKYCNAFKKAMEYKEPSKEYILKRLLFFTDGGNYDGCDEIQKLKEICIDLKEWNYKLYFFGFGDKNNFTSLEGYEPDSLYIEEDRNNFESIMESISRLFAT